MSDLDTFWASQFMRPDGSLDLGEMEEAEQREAEQARLFEPAPAPMPGQVEMPGDFDG